MFSFAVRSCAPGAIIEEGKGGEGRGSTWCTILEAWKFASSSWTRPQRAHQQRRLQALFLIYWLQSMIPMCSLAGSAKDRKASSSSSWRADRMAKVAVCEKMFTLLHPNVNDALQFWKQSAFCLLASSMSQLDWLRLVPREAPVSVTQSLYLTLSWSNAQVLNKYLFLAFNQNWTEGCWISTSFAPNLQTGTFTIYIYSFQFCNSGWLALAIEAPARSMMRWCWSCPAMSCRTLPQQES